MRGIAGELTKHHRKMAAAHLRQGRQLVQREVFREMTLEKLNCSPDARRNSRLALSFLYGSEHAQRQGADPGLKAKRTMRALILSFFHEKPAEGFRSLVDSKEMMPTRLGNHFEK